MKKPIYNLFIAIALLAWIFACRDHTSEYEKMVGFGEQYTAAWNSKKAENMASFYAEDGTLTVNNGNPSIGREQLAATANSYMEAFPDLKLTMDSLVADGDTYRYHWTFEGTNTGAGGTGNKVRFSGFERWTMNGEGLVQTSVGTYDAVDYQKQLNALNLTTAQAYNRELAYDFKDYVTIDLTFGSDTSLYWKERKSGADAHEQITTIHLNDHMTLTGWVEHDKTIVSLYSDFKAGESYGFQYFKDGSIRKLTGAISKKQ